MKAKVCPMLAQGWIAAWDSRHKFLKLQEINCMASAAEMLPKCLREDCEIWIEACLGRKGYCGLIDK